jgi:hypothetical protein
MMAKLKLTVNERKTRLCRVPADSFDFLGYTIAKGKRGHHQSCSARDLRQRNRVRHTR